MEVQKLNKTAFFVGGITGVVIFSRDCKGW
jgi:hypothetical protein